MIGAFDPAISKLSLLLVVGGVVVVASGPFFVHLVHRLLRWV